MELLYSIFSIFARHIITFVVISFCYYSVHKRLKRRTKIQRRVTRTIERIRRTNERNKSRSKLLLVMSFAHLITGLPLSVLVTLSDFNISIFGNKPETTSIVFMICHLFGMTSVFVNPIIYGFRNKHVKKGNKVQKIVYL